MAKGMQSLRHDAVLQDATPAATAHSTAVRYGSTGHGGAELTCAGLPGVILATDSPSRTCPTLCHYRTWTYQALSHYCTSHGATLRRYGTSYSAGHIPVPDSEEGSAIQLCEHWALIRTGDLCHTGHRIQRTNVGTTVYRVTSVPGIA
eukprot:1444878-Rhodomonas_salina.7